MKKRFGFLLAALAVLMMFCLAGTAGAEKRVIPEFWLPMKAGETCLPDYPDWGYMIGEGLTKEDFDISYLARSGSLKIEGDGTLTVSASASRRFYLSFDVIYTPKVEGVGEKTSFVCAAIDAGWLTFIKPNVERKIVALDQPGTIMLETNSSGFPKLAVSGYDESIISIKLRNDPSMVWHYTITPLALGETTVTVTGYNGVSCTFDVAVLAPPTELTFAQEVYHAYVGEGIDLGMKLGEGDHAPIFEKAGVTQRFAMTDTSGGIYYTSGYFPDGMTGNFVADETGKYFVEARTYNGYSDSAVVYVYKRADAVSVKMSADVIRVGETGHTVVAVDANGNGFYPRYASITKGSDIAALEGPILTTTDAGEVEVTVTNEDGSTASCTFMVEPYPNEIILNATDLTLEIGEAFDIEVGFDQGSLPYSISINESEGYDYLLPPVRIEGNRLIAQNSGTTKVRVGTDTLVALINVTVPVGDKTPMIVWPEEEPFPVNGTFQFAVKDMAGNTLPATFSLGVNDQSGTITEDGYFKAVKAGSVSVTATLEDGRKLTKSLKIVQKPNWMRVGAMIITVGESQSITVATDVGDLYTWDLEVSVKDESIVTWSYPTLRAKKVGKTEVTVTCVHNGASTTFTVEVRPENDDVFVAATSYELPYGFSMQLPAVLDAKGNEKYVKWVITHDTPGEGNPEKSGFKLEDDVITCTWPTARCEVTGYMDGASKWVRVTVFGYKMAETIRIEPEIIMLPLGEKQKVEVLTDEPGAVIPEVYWVADTEGIVSWSGYGNNAYWMFTGEKPGTTLVMAFLDNGAYALCMVTVVDPNYDPSVRLPGDANVDGSVNILDALRILQYCVGWNVEINLSNSDVDADGAVTIEDALRVLQYDAGWEVELL